MAGTERQRAKFAAFDVECTRLAALWARYVEASFEDEGSLSALPRGVNITAATKALNRYRHHKASIMAPARFPYDTAREGRFHVAWARTALRQAAKLLAVPSEI